MHFRLDKDEQEKVAAWFKALKPKIMAKQRIPDPLGDDEPYYGAIGGGLTYTITPTGLGCVLKVQEFYTGEELDLTDFDSW